MARTQKNKATSGHLGMLKVRPTWPSARVAGLLALLEASTADRCCITRGSWCTPGQAGQDAERAFGAGSRRRWRWQRRRCYPVGGRIHGARLQIEHGSSAPEACSCQQALMSTRLEMPVWALSVSDRSFCAAELQYAMRRTLKHMRLTCRVPLSGQVHAAQQAAGTFSEVASQPSTCAATPSSPCRCHAEAEKDSAGHQYLWSVPGVQWVVMHT